MAQRLHRIIPVLGLPENPTDLAREAGAIVDAIEENPDLFPEPNPPLARIRAAISRLSLAHVKSLSRAKGGVSRRKDAQAKVEMLMEHLRAYVEFLAGENLAQGELIVAKAGMKVKRPGGRHANVLGAQQGDGSGVVVLTTRRIGDRAWYEFAMSTDQKTWTSLGVSTRSKRIVRALTPGKTYYFRSRSGLKDETGDWSQVISFMPT